MAMGAFVVVGDGERVELRLRFCGSLAVRRPGAGELVPRVIFRVTLRVRRLAEGQAGPELACGRIELAGPARLVFRFALRPFLAFPGGSVARRNETLTAKYDLPLSGR